ncbi:hypothetical protein [Legionella brunensis]|uniref:Uncharacterized protein n=1 Tax=Legionella brunensis TaxID=29422 RepID=A0A0W0SLM5_9GAMM|nr:hypothetical protein [Legionella brunensis]KTC84137.1 hypothetical protein Lbru_1498 [Legionella brunensis]
MKFFCKKCGARATPKIEIVSQLSSSSVKVYFCSECHERLLQLGGYANFLSTFGEWPFALCDFLMVIYFEVKQLIQRNKAK